VRGRLTRASQGKQNRTVCRRHLTTIEALPRVVLVPVGVAVGPLSRGTGPQSQRCYTPARASRRGHGPPAHAHLNVGALGPQEGPRQAPDCARLRQILFDARLGTWWTQSWHDDRADDRVFGPFRPCQLRTCPLQSHDRCRFARRSRRNRSRRPSFLHVADIGFNGERHANGTLSPTRFTCSPMMPSNVCLFRGL